MIIEEQTGARPVIAEKTRTTAREVMRFAVGASTLGKVLVASSAKGIVAIFLGDSEDELVATLRERFPKAELVATEGVADERGGLDVAGVVRFVEAPSGAWAPPLDVRGTPFQQSVWDALRTIPSGTTVSYAEVAQRMGAPKSVRAVAGACGANPIAVVIPCHRVVRHDGDLSGYRWGVDRKRALLAREGEAMGL